ncbi:MAG: hypothetical protein RIB67_05685 [Miltoncostaeaceae bacterium]
MRRNTRPIALLVALLAAVAFAVSPAGASTLEVHGDYLDNGVIDRRHAIQDLRDALSAAEGDVQYQGLRQAVEDALDARLLGRVDAPAPAAPAEENDDDVLGLLPGPRPVDESGGPPWPLLAASMLAGMLAISGAGTSLYRRLTRGE